MFRLRTLPVIKTSPRVAKPHEALYHCTGEYSFPGNLPNVYGKEYQPSEWGGEAGKRERKKGYYASPTASTKVKNDVFHRLVILEQPGFDDTTRIYYFSIGWDGKC